MKKFVKCLITVAVGAVIALLFAASRGVFGGLDQKTLYHEFRYEPGDHESDIYNLRSPLSRKRLKS